MPTTYDKESGVLTITHIPERVRTRLLCSGAWHGLLDCCWGACLLLLEPLLLPLRQQLLGSAQDAIQYAYFASYSYQRHQSLVANLQSRDNVQLEMMGQTLDGHDLDILIIGAPSQHAVRISYVLVGQSRRVYNLGVLPKPPCVNELQVSDCTVEWQLSIHACAGQASLRQKSARCG